MVLGWVWCHTEIAPEIARIVAMLRPIMMPVPTISGILSAEISTIFLDKPLFVKEPFTFALSLWNLPVSAPHATAICEMKSNIVDSGVAFPTVADVAAPLWAMAVDNVNSGGVCQNPESGFPQW